jgi:DNA gyrase subunit A
VVARRTAFELRKARERSHILCGSPWPCRTWTRSVATIRSSRDAAEARERLMEAPLARARDRALHPADRRPAAPDERGRDLQPVRRAGAAILDLRLQRLTQLGVEEVTNELQELAGKIKEYLAILGSRERIMGIISDELREVSSSLPCRAGPRSPNGPPTSRTRT